MTNTTARTRTIEELIDAVEWRHGSRSAQTPGLTPNSAATFPMTRPSDLPPPSIRLRSRR